MRQTTVSKRWTAPTSDSQHAALVIVADALRAYLGSGEWVQLPVSSYTGKGVYYVLEAVQDYIIEQTS